MVKIVLRTFEEMGSIALENLTNLIHREFIKDTVIKAKKSEAIQQNMATQLSFLEEAYDEERQASLIVGTVQNLTAEIYDLANKRSLARTALKASFRAMMGVTDKQTVAAATMLLELINRYELHESQNVDTQTAVIKTIIKDIEERHMAALRQTGMEELLVNLKALNQAVREKRIERDRSKVGKINGRLRKARMECDLAWRELRRAVNAYAYVQGEAPYVAFISYMNTLILRYKHVHLRHKDKSTEVISFATMIEDDTEQIL